MFDGDRRRKVGSRFCDYVGFWVVVDVEWRGSGRETTSFRRQVVPRRRVQAASHYIVVGLGRQLWRRRKCHASEESRHAGQVAEDLGDVDAAAETVDLHVVWW